MTIDEWLCNKISNSTEVTQYTTEIYPDYIPQGYNVPAITYATIGSGRNRINRNIVFSLTSYHQTKSQVENLHDQLYDLFDNSTHYIRESSSDLHTINVDIVNEASLYDEDNLVWQKTLDISVWYYK